VPWPSAAASRRWPSRTIWNGASSAAGIAASGSCGTSFDSQAARQGAVRVSDLPGIGPLNGLYRDLLRPQAAGSRLAPAIMSFGRHIPGLGHYGPRDLPRRA